MNGCDNIRKMLDAYVDGALDDDKLREAADHLAECPDCRAAARRLERLNELARLPAPAVPAERWNGMWRSIEREIRRPERAARALRLPRTPALGVLAAAAVVVLLVLWGVGFIGLPEGGALVRVAYGDEVEVGGVEVFDPDCTYMYMIAGSPETTILCFLEGEGGTEGEGTEG